MRGHAYGPHREEDAPTFVDLAKGKAVSEAAPEDILAGHFVRLSPGARKQRKAINDLAYERSRHAASPLL